MKRLLLAIVFVFCSSPLWATTKYLEAGTDATQDFSMWFSNATSGSGAETSATDQAHTGARSIKSVISVDNDLAIVVSFDGTVADAGSLVSFWIRLSTVTPTNDILLMCTETTSDGSPQLGIKLTTAGHFAIVGRTASTGLSVAGTASPSANTWTRVSLSWVLTSGSSYTIKLYVNGVLDATMTNATGTITVTNGVCLLLGLLNNIPTLAIPGGGGALTAWYDDIYTDNRSDFTDSGDVRVTAKRPFANGTTNGFTTQIGAGGSGYGTGHAPQVNEQPLSQTNGWSMIGAGSAITEEYNIEGLTVGDVNLTGATIVDTMGWIFAKALVGENASLVLKGATTTAALTSTPSPFTAYAASSTYPAGTGTDIGLITTTALTTVSLYEAGILVGFNPAAAGGCAPSLTLLGVGRCN